MEIELPIQIAIRELENGLFIGEAILFPEISRFHDSIARIEPGLSGSVRAFYEKLPISGLAGRILNGGMHIHETKVMIEPVRRSMIWMKVHETARRKRLFELSTVRFYEMSGAGIVAGQTGFGMWQERCRNLIEECRKKKYPKATRDRRGRDRLFHQGNRLAPVHGR